MIDLSISRKINHIEQPLNWLTPPLLYRFREENVVEYSDGMLKY